VLQFRAWRVAIVAVWLFIPAAAAMAQTDGRGTAGSGLGLTADHKRVIYREIRDEPAPVIAKGNEIAIGAKIPDSVILTEIPIAVKDRVGLLRDFKFAKVADEAIVIVDPAKRQIVDIVTKSDGTR
jgi:hypothetical protein